MKNTHFIYILESVITGLYKVSVCSGGFNNLTYNVNRARKWWSSQHPIIGLYGYVEIDAGKSKDLIDSLQDPLDPYESKEYKGWYMLTVDNLTSILTMAKAYE